MIKLEHIYKSFHHTTILNDINLEIKDGEIISIIGPSGSGKSTILRIINHLIRPDTGKVYYNNQCITDKNAQKIRLKMGMVFQHFELFPHKTVLENITLAPVVHKILTKTEAETKAKELLKMVDLENKIYDYPNTLSGGQKQRVAIARSLSMNPDVILFDEPTSALDPEMVKDILDIIKTIATSGKTIIIVTHEINFAKNISDRILFMDHGHILKLATPDEIFNHNDNERINNFLKKVL